MNFYLDRKVKNYYKINTFTIVHWIKKIPQNLHINLSQFTGSSQGAGDLPSIYIVLLVHRGICMVCSITGEEVLHEAILTIRVDPCGTFDCRHTELFNNTEYI